MGSTVHGGLSNLVMASQLLRALLTTGFIVLLFNISDAQKNDYLWLFGYNYNSGLPGAEAFNLNFDTFPPRIKTVERNMFFINGYSNICDSTGNELLTSNNCRIIDRDGETITNGDDMLQDWEFNWCNTYGHHPYEFYSAFLPAPGQPGRIYYFNKSTYFKPSPPPLEIYTNKFRYSIIELEDSLGSERVTLKNKVLINDKLGYGQLASVKHGNGRDWWLPVPVETGNKIYLVLLGKDTVYVHHAQNLGPAWNQDGGFQANFSLDGTKYVRYNRFHGVYIYDFDRCDGILSNLIHFDFNDTTQGIYGGCAISPNNRWLYIADFDYLYQFDLQASDILGSKQLIGSWDGTSNNLPTKFSYIIFGPDRRLYVFPPTTTKNMHVINRPDLPGDASDFRQRELEFPYPYQNTPVFPNFRLGPLDGSPCDTLGIDNHPLADFRPDPSDTNHLAIHFWDVSSYLPAEWLWNFGDGSPVSQDISPVHTFPAPGFYTVCLTVGNPYGVSSKCKVVEVKVSSTNTEPSGQGERSSVLFYPNPTTGWLEWNVIADGESMRLRVYDALGRLCFERETSDNKANLSELPDGVYFVSLLGENGRIVATKAIVLAKK